MAERTRTYSSSDWSIWTYVPEEDSFVLDYSVLDGSDVLGTTGGSLVQSDVKITEMTITEGTEVQDGFWTPVTPSSLQVGLLFDDFDLSISRQFLNGQDISVTIKNEQDNPDPTYGLNTLMFKGKISSFNAMPEPGTTIVNAMVTANSDLFWQLNTQVNIDTRTDQWMGEQIEIAAALVGIPIYSDQIVIGAGPYQFGEARNVIRTLGEWLNNYQQILTRPAVDSLEIAYVETDGEIIYRIGYSDSYLTPQYDFALDSSEISGATFGWNGEGSPTGVSLTLATDEAVQYQVGSASTSSSSDAFIYTQTLDVNGLDQLITAGQQMMSMTKEYGALTISTETAREYQDITFDGYIFISEENCFVTVKNLGAVGAVCSLSLPEYGLERDYLVTGRIIEVTPENWTTTYNLWKGFN